jgi:ABC-type multidrug transport system ATPase subunit
MWALIEGLRRAGKTVFLTTHCMEEAQRLADRIVILQAGAIAAQGTAEQPSRALGHGTRIGFLAPPQIARPRYRRPWAPRSSRTAGGWAFAATRPSGT